MATASSSVSSASFDDYNTELQGVALKTTRAAVSLPADISFHRTVHPDFGKELDRCSARVLSLTNKLLHLSSTINASTSARAKGKARLETQDDVADNFHSLVVDAMDQLLERADIGLDDFLGHLKAPAIEVNPTPITNTQKKKNSNVAPGRLDPALQHASHLAKPQLTFKKAPDNSYHNAWTPSLRHKYNAQVPLGYNFKHEGENVSSSLHPYGYEIKHLSYPSRMFTSNFPISPRSFEDTPFTWISTPEALATMLEKLRAAKEIAIDLEHHSYRSFSGFVCLMQISTREEDFVIDTLALRDEIEELNEVFTNPAVVKVLHGAESDIIWLQQDFNLYIVNLFDTYHASKVLDFPRHGLAALLEMYCDYTADKRYQLADWRIRPLPDEMLQYARSDTHFLLFIYDNLRNALLDRAQSRAQSPSASTTPPPDPSIPPAHLLVREVLSRSEETALRVYEKEVYDADAGTGPGGWDTLARKWNKTLLTAVSASPEAGSAASVQRAVYRAVHAWRDRIAREQDESTRYVLPNHYLFSLAERTPADMAGLLSVFHPVPPVIRRRAKDLLDAIREATKEALGTPDTIPVTEGSSVSTSVSAGMTAVEDSQPSAQATMTPLNTSATSMWSNVPSITASSSTLFGNTLQKSAVTALPIAKHSSMLGAQFAISRSVRNRAQFLETATRIHSTLAIAPIVPNITRPTVDTATVATDVIAAPMVDDKDILKNEGTTEMPFVPVSQRRQTATGPVDDTIVVVGQAKPKKRKRPAEQKAESAPSAASTKMEPVKVEAFDYASVPNILDDEKPRGGDVPSSKKKHKGSNATFYGNFPAPPKAPGQTKSGNQSRTFR